MAPMGVYDQIKKAFQDIVAPELHALRGEIRVLDQRIVALDEKLEHKISALDEKLEHKISALDEKLEHKISALDEKLEHKISALDEKLDHKVGALDQKLDAVEDRLTIRIDALGAQVASHRAELLAELRRVDNRIDSVDRELRTAIDVRERLAALEARLPA